VISSEEEVDFGSFVVTWKPLRVCSEQFHFNRS